MYIMVLFICNYDLVAEKLEWALSFFNDIIFQWWIQFLP